MSAELELSLNPAAMQHLLQGTDEFFAPAVILGGLTGEQACAIVPGLPHSIATLLGHMVFWQEWSLAWARSGEMAEASEKLNFPAVSPKQWPELVERFLAGFDQLCALCEQGDTAREFHRGCSLGLVLASQSSHNAYHLGQIVLLRRLQGSWPPPGKEQ